MKSGLFSEGREAFVEILSNLHTQTEKEKEKETFSFML